MTTTTATTATVDNCPVMEEKLKYVLSTLTRDLLQMTGMPLDTKRPIKRVAKRLSKRSRAEALEILNQAFALAHRTWFLPVPVTTTPMWVVQAQIKRHSQRETNEAKKVKEAKTFNIPERYRSKFIAKMGTTNAIKAGIRLHEPEPYVKAGLVPWTDQPLPTPAKRNAEGRWIHVLNHGTDIGSLAKIKGEICVSSYDKGSWFTTRGYMVAALFEGKVREYFEGDCYSEVLSSGRRYATRDPQDMGHSHDEGWLTPSDSKIIAILVSENTPAAVIDKLEARYLLPIRVVQPPGRGHGISKRKVRHRPRPENLSRWEAEAAAWGYDV